MEIPRTTPARFAKYRYRLLEVAMLCGTLPALGWLTIDAQAAILEKEYGIRPDQFHYDRYRLLSSTREMSEGRLRIYAHFYNVTEEQLRNSPLPTGPTLAEAIVHLERTHSAVPVPTFPRTSQSLAHAA